MREVTGSNPVSPTRGKLRLSGPLPSGPATAVDELDLLDDVLLAGDPQAHRVAHVDAPVALGRDRRPVAGVGAVHADLLDRRCALAGGEHVTGVDGAIGLAREDGGGELDRRVAGVHEA